MSYGCGTLASPSGFATGIAAASSSNGKQHTLPRSPRHKLLDSTDIEAHWSTAQLKGPTRLWGSTKASRFGGEELLDGEPDLWLSGDFWNVDSNIRKWTEHEVRRNAAAASHDIHRHDQITRVSLPPHPGDKRTGPPRQCISGVVSADSCFLEAWGFDLGCRDRQARPTPLWKPPSKGEQFRSLRSFDRNVPRILEYSRSLLRSTSMPSLTANAVATLRPEDIGGEAGELKSADDTNVERAGRTYGSRSCHYWDAFGHVVKREAAKQSCGIHSPAFRSHPDYPYINDQLAPAAVYTRRYRQGGEEALRQHVSSGVRVPLK